MSATDRRSGRSNAPLAQGKDGVVKPAHEKHTLEVVQCSTILEDSNVPMDRISGAAKVLDRGKLHATKAERLQVLRRIDMFCLPLMGLVFIQTFLDRVRITPPLSLPHTLRSRALTPMRRRFASTMPVC